MSTGQIHDLGYKRYVGTRRPLGTRWQVVMRHQLATGWKTWWRFKIWLVTAVIATSVAAGVLYFLSDKTLKVFGGMNGAVVQFVDGILPASVWLYCKIGFIVSLTVGATAVAGDVRSGAFTLYFSRSLRPRDYVLGKLAGLGVLLALIMALGPVLLAGLRLGLSKDFDQLIALSPIVYKAFAVGLLGTLIYAAVPLGFSALIPNPGYAIALWAAYYLVVGTMAQGIALVTSGAVAALDLPSALEAISYALFGVQRRGLHSVQIPAGVALISILGHGAAAIGLVFWRVRNAQMAGVGGSS